MTLLSVSPLPVQGNRQQKKTKTTLTSRRKRKVYLKIRFRRRRTHTPASPPEFHPAQHAVFTLSYVSPRLFFSIFFNPKIAQSPDRLIAVVPTIAQCNTTTSDSTQPTHQRWKNRTQTHTQPPLGPDGASN